MTIRKWATVLLSSVDATMPLSVAADHRHSQQQRMQSLYVQQQQQARQNRTTHQTTAATPHVPWWTMLHSSRATNTTPPTWSYTCHHCHALLLSDESHSVCCQDGRHALPRLPPWPAAFQSLLQHPTRAKQFSTLIDLRADWMS